MKPFIERIAEDRPMLYDGGFGSQLFERGIELTNSTLANEEHPDAVVEVHRAYIEAGVDAIGSIRCLLRASFRNGRERPNCSRRVSN